MPPCATFRTSEGAPAAGVVAREVSLQLRPSEFEVASLSRTFDLGGSLLFLVRRSIRICANDPQRRLRPLNSHILLLFALLCRFAADCMSDQRLLRGERGHAVAARQQLPRRPDDPFIAAVVVFLDPDQDAAVPDDVVTRRDNRRQGHYVTRHDQLGTTDPFRPLPILHPDLDALSLNSRNYT